MLDSDKIMEIKKQQNLFVSSILPKIRTQIDSVEDNAYNIDKLIDFTAIGEESKRDFNELIKCLKENAKEIETLNKNIDESIVRIKNRGASIV